MITLNVTMHDDVGGAFNIDETRKQTIFEAIDSLYLDNNTKVRIIFKEIFDEIVERDLHPAKVNILMQDNDLFDEISEALDNWDIDLLKL